MGAHSDDDGERSGSGSGEAGSGSGSGRGEARSGRKRARRAAATARGTSGVQSATGLTTAEMQDPGNAAFTSWAAPPWLFSAGSYPELADAPAG